MTRKSNPKTLLAYLQNVVKIRTIILNEQLVLQVGDSGAGTSWMQMSGRMTSVSVAPNDQVN